MIQNPANLCGISPLSHHGSHCNDLALHVTAPKLPKSYLLIACFITLGVDLVPIKAIHNVITIQEDITTDRCRQVYGCILLQRIVVEFNNWKIMINFIHLKHNQTSSYDFYQACTKSYTPSLDRMPAHPSPRYFIKFPSQFSTTNDLKNFCCS